MRHTIDASSTIVTPPPHLGAGADRRRFSAADWGLFGAVGTIWGSSFLLIKLALESFHPGLITWGRIALAAVVLLLVPGRRIPLERSDLGTIVALSLLWVGIPFTLYPLAEQHISSAVTGLLTGATPFFTGLAGTLWFGRSSRGPQQLGIAVGFIGVALISVSSGAIGGNAPRGIAYVLLATVCYGLATNMASPLQHKYGSVRLMSLMLAFGALWTTPLGILGLIRSEPALVPLVATVTLGVVGTGAAFVLMGTLIGRVGGPRASFITYLIPLVALVLGMGFLGEKATPLALGGAGLVLVASVLASRREE